MIIYLSLFAVALAAAALGAYVGRITAPTCQRQHYQTQIHIANARLTKLDADGKPVGPSMPLPSGARTMTMEFTAEGVNPAAFEMLMGEEAAAKVFRDGGRPVGTSTGRHAVVPPDEDETQVIKIDDQLT